MFLIRGMVAVAALIVIVAIIIGIVHVITLLPAWAGFLVIFVVASALIGLMVSDDNY